MLDMFSYPLYIVGNGFDLHHQIPSSYRAFGEFVRQTDQQTYGCVERYFAMDDNFWYEFENRLASLDTDTIIEESEGFLVGYGADDWSDANHHDYQYEIGQAVDAISKTLRKRFAQWVRQLPIPTSVGANLRLRIDPAGRFLNFNYTPSLQQIYGVPDDRVLHIHGKANDATETLVLGHGYQPDSNPDPYRDFSDPEEADIRIVEGRGIIDGYFNDTFKPTASIIEDKKQFFTQLADVTDVLVMGHSLAEVDYPYFEEVLNNIDTCSVRWKVSVFGDDEAGKRATIEGFGIAPALVQFLPLGRF